MIYDHQLYPLAMPQVDWTTFCQSIQKAFNDKVTVGNAKQPSAFLKAIDENVLSTDGRDHRLKHCSISFLCITNHPTPLVILDFKGYLCKDPIRFQPGGYSAYILTGDMQQWYFAIIESCSKISVIDNRLIGNVAHGFLVTAGFADMWSQYKRKSLPDQTFILERRR